MRLKETKHVTLDSWEEIEGKLLDIKENYIIFHAYILEVEKDANHLLPELTNHIGQNVAIIKTDLKNNPYRFAVRD